MVDMSTAERAGEGRTTEDVSVTHAMSVVQPGATLPPWTRIEVPKARRVEEDASVIAPGVVVMGLRSASAPSTSTTTEEAVPEERPQRVGSLIRGASVEPP
jgi:hypothetical protein